MDWIRLAAVVILVSSPILYLHNRTSVRLNKIEQHLDKIEQHLDSSKIIDSNVSKVIEYLSDKYKKSNK